MVKFDKNINATDETSLFSMTPLGQQIVEISQQQEQITNDNLELHLDDEHPNKIAQITKFCPVIRSQSIDGAKMLNENNTIQVQPVIVRKTPKFPSRERHMAIRRKKHIAPVDEERKRIIWDYIVKNNNSINSDLITENQKMCQCDDIETKTCQACKCPRETHALYHEQMTSVRDRLGFKQETHTSKIEPRQLGYTWVPPGLLTSAKVQRYFDMLPQDKVPKIGSAGERNRDKQLVYQLPKQDLALTYCKHVETRHRSSYEDFVSGRNEIALDIGYIKDASTTSKCVKCNETINQSEMAVIAPKFREQMIWHPKCFQCSECNELLVDLTYCVYEDKVYCERHYAEMLKPRCSACDEDGNKNSEEPVASKSTNAKEDERNVSKEEFSGEPDDSALVKNPNAFHNKNEHEAWNKSLEHVQQSMILNEDILEDQGYKVIEGVLEEFGNRKIRREERSKTPSPEVLEADTTNALNEITIQIELTEDSELSSISEEESSPEKNVTDPENEDSESYNRFDHSGSEESVILKTSAGEISIKIIDEVLNSPSNINQSGHAKEIFENFNQIAGTSKEIEMHLSVDPNASDLQYSDETMKEYMVEYKEEIEKKTDVTILDEDIGSSESSEEIKSNTFDEYSNRTVENVDDDNENCIPSEQLTSEEFDLDNLNEIVEETVPNGQSLEETFDMDTNEASSGRLSRNRRIENLNEIFMDQEKLDLDENQDTTSDFLTKEREYTNYLLENQNQTSETEEFQFTEEDNERVESNIQESDLLDFVNVSPDEKHSIKENYIDNTDEVENYFTLGSYSNEMQSDIEQKNREVHIDQDTSFFINENIENSIDNTKNLQYKGDLNLSQGTQEYYAQLNETVEEYLTNKEEYNEEIQKTVKLDDFELVPSSDMISENKIAAKIDENKYKSCGEGESEDENHTKKDEQKGKFIKITVYKRHKIKMPKGVELIDAVDKFIVAEKNWYDFGNSGTELISKIKDMTNEGNKTSGAKYITANDNALNDFEATLSKCTDPNDVLKIADQVLEEARTVTESINARGNSAEKKRIKKTFGLGKEVASVEEKEIDECFDEPENLNSESLQITDNEKLLPLHTDDITDDLEEATGSDSNTNMQRRNSKQKRKKRNTRNNQLNSDNCTDLLRENFFFPYSHK